jgi:simple sugar transport system permease protein
MLNSAVPLILGALGITIAMKTGCLNLGGEGQVYIGSFITTIMALSLSQIGALGAVMAIIAGSLFTGFIAGASGFFRAKWNTSEIITTFFLSCAIIPVVNYLVTNTFLDPHTSLISTEKIAYNMRLPLIIQQSNLNIGIIIAVVFVFIVNYFLFNSKLGYQFRITGHNEIFARYGGINTKLNIVLAMTLSGALYGFAGGLTILGTHHAVIKEFSAGLGWSGLTVALIAGFSPIAVIPSALFLAWINTGARIAMQNTGLTHEVAHIVQAAIFFLSTSLVFKNFFAKKGM